MKKKEKNKSFSGKKFIKGFLVGGAICGGATLLLAPRSGKETQQSITNKIEADINFLLSLSNQIDTTKIQANRLVTLSQELLPVFEKETTKSLKKFEFKAKPRIEQIKEQLAKIEQDITEFKDTLEQ
ncbi:YtxH domain-containing protein [Vagococcus luciliae]|uniref:YtxH domain-containing protein n=1 Tax=Vagococcus luciliae TaxID=2920380 RepID=A0ABY5NWI9_9ENTE|nr:YtxH domain-containing protein [Vagococcus luciliae]UUV98015.1 hypothetical protein G314FT_01060 [Vagococcus luciliae]